jgi:hypothetical protein
MRTYWAIEKNGSSICIRWDRRFSTRLVTREQDYKLEIDTVYTKAKGWSLQKIQEGTIRKIDSAKEKHREKSW